MKRSFFIVLLTVLTIGTSFGQIPRTISYQGALLTSQGSPVADGKHSLMISLYNALSGGTLLFKESQSVDVTNGIFNCIIGAVTPIPQGLTFDTVYYLGLSVDSSSELIPRTAFTSVPYALHAQVAEGLSPNAVIPPGLVIGSTAPSGPAVGDLWGNYPDPLVIGLQGRPISTLLPMQGDLFTWTGANWGPLPEQAPIAFHIRGDSISHGGIAFTIKSGNGLFDDGNFFDNEASAFVVPRSGVYRFDLHLNVSALAYSNANVLVHLTILLIADGQVISQQDFDPTLESVYNDSEPSVGGLHYSPIVKLSQGQLVQFQIKQTVDPLISGFTADLNMFRLN